jgi:DNA-binding beta-propeller fold protein YncE
MRQTSEFDGPPVSFWKPALLVALILFTVTVAAAQETSSHKFAVKTLLLPGANGLVMLDYFAYDHASQSLWVPAANTGSVDVIDTATDEIKRVEGFSVAEVELRGKRRSVGPSSVAIGDGVVYIGSRADSKICVINSHTLKLGDCVAFAPPSAGLAAAPDGLVYIAATRELWATSGAPPIGIPAANRSIKIFSASQPTKLAAAGKIPLPGSAEGYAVDNVHGLFYTNIEETGQTVAIDVRKRAVVSTWRSCDDPSGVAADNKRGFVFVACSDHVIVLDTAHDGRPTGSIPTGTGVDNIDYSENTGLLYAAAAEAAQLTVARIDDNGRPTLLARVPTTKGARSVVAGANGCAYLIDPLAGGILKVEPDRGQRTGST